jgi:hypothetical protein
VVDDNGLAAADLVKFHVTAMELVRFVPEADLSLQLEKFWQCRVDLHGE